MKDNGQKSHFWQFETIIAYLKGQLSVEDTLAFEEAMENDEALVQEMEQVHDELLQNPKLEEEVNAFQRQFAPQMQAIAEEEQKETPTVKQIKIWPWVAAAASVALVAWFFFLNPTADCALDNGPCLASLDGIYVNRIVNKGQNAETDLKSALLLFQQERYADAIPLLKEFVIPDSNSFTQSEVKLCLGIAQLMENQSNAAQLTLSELRSAEDPRYAYEANWYIALAYLSQAENEKAILILQTLAKEKNRHQASAQTLLQKLNISK